MNFPILKIPYMDIFLPRLPRWIEPKEYDGITNDEALQRSREIRYFDQRFSLLKFGDLSISSFQWFLPIPSSSHQLTFYFYFTMIQTSLPDRVARAGFLSCRVPGLWTPEDTEYRSSPTLAAGWSQSQNTSHRSSTDEPQWSLAPASWTSYESVTRLKLKNFSK